MAWVEVDFLAVPDWGPERTRDEIEELVAWIAERHRCRYQVLWESCADRGHGTEVTVSFIGDGAEEAAVELQKWRW